MTEKKNDAEPFLLKKIVSCFGGDEGGGAPPEGRTPVVGLDDVAPLHHLFNELLLGHVVIDSADEDGVGELDHVVVHV